MSSLCGRIPPCRSCFVQFRYSEYSTMAVPLEKFLQQLEDSGILASETIKDFIPPKASPKDAENLPSNLSQEETDQVSGQLKYFQREGKISRLGQLCPMEPDRPWWNGTGLQGPASGHGADRGCQSVAECNDKRTMLSPAFTGKSKPPPRSVIPTSSRHTTPIRPMVSTSSSWN